MRFLGYTILSFALPLAVVSCGDGIDIDSDNPEGNELVVIQDHVLDSASSMNTNIGGKMFSIPSPIQMATMIKGKIGVFNENILTDPEGVANFTTEFKRAINMGVYGADLGYATIYENNTKAISYLSSIEQLSDELGISGAFDQDLLERFIENGSEQDSMLVIMSEGYRKGDQFLKDNEQHDIASLVLTGGWIESMYFAAVTYENSRDQEIANRIGEQKTALKTITELLVDFNDDEFYTTLIEDLKVLQGYFKNIEYNYEYIEPVTDIANKTTIIKSKTSVKIEGGVLDKIIDKVKSIRNGLVS